MNLRVLASGKLTIVYCLIFLLMILLRMVWIQLRHYHQDFAPETILAVEHLEHFLPHHSSKQLLPVEYTKPDFALDKESKAWLAPLGSILFFWGMGLDPAFSFSIWTKKQTHFFFAVVFFSVLVLRLVTHSWVISLAGGAILLSRGAILTSLGDVGIDYVLMLCLAFWFMCHIHFMQTGSALSLYFLVLVSAAAALFHPTCLVLCLITPFLLCATSLKDLLKKRNIIPKTIQRGGVLKSIQMPFFVWTKYGPRRRNLIFGWLVVFTMVCLVLLNIKVLFCGNVLFHHKTDFIIQSVSWHNLNTIFPFWLKHLFFRLDLHYWVCIGMMIVSCCASSSEELLNSRELALTLITLTIFLFFASFLAFFCDVAFFGDVASLPPIIESLVVHSSSRFFTWLEPIYLSLSLSGVYNLTRIYFRSDHQSGRVGQGPAPCL